MKKVTTKLQNQLNELVGQKITGVFVDPIDGKVYIQTKSSGPIQIVKSQFNG